MTAYLELADYLLIAEAVLWVPAELARSRSRTNRLAAASRSRSIRATENAASGDCPMPSRAVATVAAPKLDTLMRAAEDYGVAVRETPADEIDEIRRSFPRAGETWRIEPGLVTGNGVAPALVPSRRWPAQVEPG